MSNENTNRKVVNLSNLNVKSRQRGSKKLGKWVPMLDWERPGLSNAFLERRGYLMSKEQYIELVDDLIEMREANLAEQNAEIDAELTKLGVKEKVAGENIVTTNKYVLVRL